MAYLPLSTANLPDPAIDPAQGSSPVDYFDVFTWTGTGNTGRSFTDLSFQPDLVWAKDRTNAYGHVLFDSVRGAGANKELGSQSTGAEGYASTSTYDYLSSFDSNGFTSTYSGSNFAAYFNNSGDSYVAWNWKANGSATLNDEGSIDSQVSANTAAGFSIVTFTGTGSNETVGHGLSSAPDCILFLRRDTSGSDHKVYHSALGATKNLRFNNSDAVRTDSTFFDDTEPTLNVFTVGGSRFASSSTHVAYCFHNVEGFSKFSSYVGNGNADGPFVYTGFRPAFIMSKRTDSTGDWHMYDVARDEYNVAYKAIWANYSSAEYLSYNNVWDILSNGFKARTSSVITNASGGTYIYMAFAENPFKYSNAR